MSRLFIVSNRLPLTIEKADEKYNYRQSSGGLISAVNAYLNSEGNGVFAQKIWAGVPGCSEKVWDMVAANIDAEYDYLPVFVQNKAYDHYYNGFANSVLWPLFHYFPSFADYQPSFFEAYKTVNEHFANELCKQLRPDDTVWIHDYHLLPLAAILRKRHPSLTIGIFLHIPFPSYELFRVIPKQWQREILTGMLGADLIGFHTCDYVTHFLNCTAKILKASADDNVIAWEDRQIKVAEFPISIDYEQFSRAYDDVEVLRKRADYLRLKQDKQLIFSVDRLDYTKGVYNRLKGYREFLVQHPEYKGKVVFALVIVPSRDTISKYAERKKMIDEYIGNFNSRFGHIGWQPVIYQYGHLEFHELIAMYTACDLALITPLRDGMNLVSKEFVASRKDQQGVLVLSEMAGAAHELTDALLINPNDRCEIAAMIKAGLEMKPAEQQQRMAAMQACISRYNVNTWAADYFKHLKQAKAQQLDMEATLMDNFSKAKLLQKYTQADRRLLLLDYDGTLVPFVKEPSKAAPGVEMIAVLGNLAADPKNEVFIVSGRDSYTLEGWLGNLPIGLIAEHGAKFRPKDGNWEATSTTEVVAGLQKVEQLMAQYAEKIQGSFIERKDFSLAWHYRTADPVMSPVRAKQLYNELLDLTAKLPLNVLNGHKVIEVKGEQTDKGRAVEKVLKNEDYDFVLCIGDDQTDEDMFRKLVKVPNAFTIKVGAGASLAKYNVLTPYLVQSLLQSIAGSTEMAVSAML